MRNRVNCSADLVIAVILITSVTLFARPAGQQEPTATDYNQCAYWSAWENLDNLKLAAVLGPGSAESLDTWSHTLKPCSPEKGDCEPSGTVRAGLPVVVHEVREGWACVWTEDYWKGSGRVWMRADRLKEIAADPHPPLSSWVGTWRLVGAKPIPTKRETAENDRLVITKSEKAGVLHIAGKAYWDADFDGQPVVHRASVNGMAKPEGNRLRVTQYDCEVNLKLIGGYLLAQDNLYCGQLNARFGAIWQKQTRVH